MSETHRIAQLIINKSLDTTEGQRKFIENIETGKLEIEISWNRRKYKMEVKYKKTNMFEEFPNCMIKYSGFMELVMRSQTLTMNGSHSKATDFILSSPTVLSFFDISKSKIGVNGKFLTFQMDILRDNQELLSDIFWGFETIGEEFDEFLSKNK